MATHPSNSTGIYGLEQGTIKCTSSSTWENPVSSLCEEIRCPRTIANGNMSTKCSRLIHDGPCEYYCSNGYVRVSDRSNLECDRNGQWVLLGFSASKSSSFCVRETELCPANIQNGSLYYKCIRTEGNACSYACDDGCKSNPKAAFLATCSNRTWSVDGEQLCIDCRRCNLHIPGGRVISRDCYANSNCSYECDYAYEKISNITSIKCSDTHKWVPSIPLATFSSVNEFCIPKLCSEIPNGQILKSDSCQTPKDGAICTVQCDDHFHGNISHITCQALQKSNGEVDMYWRMNGTRVSPLSVCTNNNQCPIDGIPHATLEQSCTRKAGDTCNFTCDAGFQASQTYALCWLESKWHIPFSSRCVRIRCSETIPNGRIDPSCSRFVNNLCYTYNCDWGFQRSVSDSHIKCNASGEWEWEQFSTVKFCLSDEELCPSYIKNGHLGTNCIRTEGYQCMYYCNTGCRYSYSVNILTCKNRTWGRDTDLLCSDCHSTTTTTTTSPIRCPSFIPDGYVSSFCERLPLTSCDYTCNFGCTKYFTTIQCSAYGEWYSDYAACHCPEKPTCPYSIPNGYIYGTCDYSAGSVCSVSCYSNCYGFHDSNVICDSTGQWNLDNYGCQCDHSTTVKPEDSRTGSISVFGIAGIVLAICFLVGVIVGCRFYNKRLMSSNRSGNDDSVSQRPTRDTHRVDRVPMSQYQAPSETQQSNGNNFSQRPPAYSEIAFTKPDPVEQPPSYEEVTAHPLSFSTNLRGTNV